MPIEMKILVCNVGSTSLKFKLYQMPQGAVLARGRVERVGSREDALFGYANDVTGYSVDLEKQDIPSYSFGVRRFLDCLTDRATV